MHRAADGAVYLSWLTAGDDATQTLHYARFADGRWSPAQTVVAGEHWFVNWADFPSVVTDGARSAAHWLVQRPRGSLSYEVAMRVSTDAGQTWSSPFVPHDDDTDTEHGFVSIEPGPWGFDVFWLDGRNTPGGESDHADHGGDGPMSLRHARLDDRGTVLTSTELDPRVCDCCQTDSARTADGLIVVYRDRSAEEVRDIRAIVLNDGGGTLSVPVAEDGWEIAGCPVNGPAVAASGDDVAVVWFTGANDKASVRFAWSRDGGHRFADARDVDTSGNATGRVDVVILDDGDAIVSWIGHDSGGADRLLLRRIRRDGQMSERREGPRVSASRTGGFPQMTLSGDVLLMAWTQTGEPPTVRAATLALAEW